MSGRAEVAVLRRDVRILDNRAGREGAGREAMRLRSFSSGARDDEA